jgi:hypothetical protein
MYQIKEKRPRDTNPQRTKTAYSPQDKKNARIEELRKLAEKKKEQ